MTNQTLFDEIIHIFWKHLANEKTRLIIYFGFILFPFRLGASQDKIRTWLQTLTNKATTSDSRNNCGQLSSLLHYFTKPSLGESIPVKIQLREIFDENKIKKQ